jgi:hypothetical protein
VSAHRAGVGAPAARPGQHDGLLTIGLPAEVVEMVVERAAALIAERQPPEPERLLTVDELAEHLRVAPDWVRRHQAALGAFRLTDGGGRNPIRFRPSDVDKFLLERRLTPPTKAGAGGWRDDPDWASG